MGGGLCRRDRHSVIHFTIYSNRQDSMYIQVVGPINSILSTESGFYAERDAGSGR